MVAETYITNQSIAIESVALDVLLVLTALLEYFQSFFWLKSDLAKPRAAGTACYGPVLLLYGIA